MKNTTQSRLGFTTEVSYMSGFSLTLNKGFTLIELLVVVLIIGILAAVALPQYQNAVDKTRAKEFIIALSAANQAAKRCYLANGSLENCNLTALDIHIPPLKNFTFSKRSTIGDVEIRYWGIGIGGVTRRLQFGSSGQVFYRGDPSMMITTEWLEEKPIKFTSICTGDKCTKMFDCLPSYSGCYLFNETW